MTDENKKDEIIDVKEELDGSAVIELPESIPSPDVKEEETKKVEEDSDEADEAARQRELAEGGAIDEDAEAVREAKRQKRRARKEYHKQVAAEKDTKLHLLERQNQELLERLSIVEKKTQGTEIARINKAIEDQETRILFAKQKIKEATETGNGDLLTQAQEMWFEAKKQFESLENLKKQSVSQPQHQTVQAPDPMVQRFASNWMMENDWYDPNGSDVDSSIALKIDQALANEGWNPKTQEYWEELDNRLAKYLPHRYSSEVETSVSPSTRRPRNVVTSSGRENAASSGGKGNTFTLTPDQVRAMKDAGMWDDPEKRAKMIRRYATEKLNQR
jgi:hypothetical protein